MSSKGGSRESRFITVVDPAMRKPELEAFNRIAANSPLPLHYHLPALYGHDTLHEAHGEPRGIIILGSLSSVNDGHDWQKALGEWLRAKWRRGIPTLGVCFGHQLIAHLHGGKVGMVFQDGRKHCGLRKIQLAPNPLWGGVARDGEVAVSHEEEVKTCPDGFQVAGSSPEVPIEALAHEELPIWSFQCHPEATPTFFKNRKIDDKSNGAALKFGHFLVQSFLDYAGNKK